jgi:hypothetical protein
MHVSDRLSLCLVALLAVLLMAAPEHVLSGQGAGRLVNPGFEIDPVQTGWELNVYGAPPRVERDKVVVHEGRGSLRVAADAPSDTALWQEIRLKPGQAYRLRGWVKTRGLSPRGAPVYGTFQVQMPGGRGVLASGANHGGDTDGRK